jgi:spore maturation protein CgeB
MKFVIFGLAISSSWGNGHATIWRGLCSALAKNGHSVTFFERDVPYYAAHRDLPNAVEYELFLYSDWKSVEHKAHAVLNTADCAFVTSYCPDAIPASDLVLDSRASLRIFYDLDTPVTLEKMRTEGCVDYIPAYGLAPFDLVLSYTGGRALLELQSCLDAQRVFALFGSADPDVHQPVTKNSRYHSDLSYLGTYAADRQAALEELFLEPARRSPGKKFVIGGAQYPRDFPWSENIWFLRHVPPSDHSAFYSSSNLTLSITRSAMAAMGYCPSGRLFEAAACGTPVISDYWEGLEDFFEPGREILIASHRSDVLDAIALGRDRLWQIGHAARERVLAQHTARHRCEQLIRLLEAVA